MARPSHPRLTLGAVAAFGALTLFVACQADAPTDLAPNQPASTARAGYDVAGMHRQYGPPQKVGNGMARAYVVLDAKAGQAPAELGIALDEKALDGLPGNGMMYAFDLELPAQSPAPYRFAELDWNPHGHVPPGVYTVPHFDFHFYTVPPAARDAIDPSDPDFAAEASNLPTGDLVPPFYVVPGPPAAVAVPHMGVHWSDVRSPELQGLLGNPAGYQPFTKTFIYGSWNGSFTFLEPMVTRDYLLSHPDAVSPISVPARYAQPGWYPTSYRVTYDAQAKEYRIALSGMTQH
jgi:hypothetical protein